MTKIPIKTLKSGFSLPAYGLGTWQMGGRGEVDYDHDEEDIAAIQAAIDRGVTHIDTAESYASGHSEEIVGEAIKNYDRSKLIIATKVSAWNQGYDDLLRSFEGSIKRLESDYVDLYLLHRYPEAGIDIKTTMKAMDRLVDEGVVKNIGVCNLTNNRFSEVQKHTSNKLVYNQVHYSLESREPQARGILDYAIKEDFFVSAWGPLSKGSLQQAPILHELAKKYQKTPYQIALNWLISQENVITIPKTAQIKHLEENLGSLGWSLSGEDIIKLTENFPNQLRTSDRVPLDYEADIEP
jgi:diketogulonate reductase-like aldo/keto reductase